MATNPTLLAMPLAQNGQKNVIPETQATAGNGLFSQSTGFPAETSIPLGAGGVAPSREDFNGMANLLGGVAFYAQKGWTFNYDATQDYYKGCVVIDPTDGKRYECVVDMEAGTIAPSADTTGDYWRLTLDNYLLRQNSHSYAVGDIAFSASLPSYLVLECTTPGTTAATEPDFSGAEEGGTVTDGEVVWTYKLFINGGLDREQIPAFNHRDVITTSGTYTAPVDGWYKITVKGGGGGGGSAYSGSGIFSGGGGGEGGTTIAYEKMSAGDNAVVIIGAGGQAPATNAPGGNGGDSTVTIAQNTYVGGGGVGGSAGYGAFSQTPCGAGGNGTIPGASGGPIISTYTSVSYGYSSPGAGAGGGSFANNGVDGRLPIANSGGGGAGGTITNAGQAGADGYVWFNYFAEV